MARTIIGAVALAALARGAQGFTSSGSGAVSSLPATSWRTTPVRRGRSLAAASVEVADVKKCLSREYTSFFTPMEKEFYEQDVTFVDPLSTLVGIDKYANNVDLLAGRTPLGSFLFSDASILLHSVDETGPNQLRTRWTLRMTISGLPWKPTARFTGVSDYTLSAGSGKIAKQQDYWDSVNLEGGRYGAKDLISGIKDFVAQVKPADDGGCAAVWWKHACAGSSRARTSCTGSATIDATPPSSPNPPNPNRSRLCAGHGASVHIATPWHWLRRATLPAVPRGAHAVHEPARGVR